MTVCASYGGYAALMGVVKTPDLYRCAVSFGGVSDLPDLTAHQSDYAGGQEWAEEVIGKVWGDRERLRATSPARQAEASACRCCWCMARSIVSCRSSRAPTWPRRSNPSSIGTCRRRRHRRAPRPAAAERRRAATAPWVRDEALSYAASRYRPT